jgi:C4-dicarboxylate-specific signal transduction histidine kinase
VGTIAEFLFVIFLPTAAGFAILGAIRGSRRLAEARRQAAARKRPAPPEPVERLAATLRRLRAELERTEAIPGGVAKNHRIRAVRGAYTDALSTACQRLGVPPPPGGDRAKLADIYRAEAALRQRGLDVREPAAG